MRSDCKCNHARGGRHGVNVGSLALNGCHASEARDDRDRLTAGYWQSSRVGGPVLDWETGETGGWTYGWGCAEWAWTGGWWDRDGVMAQRVCGMRGGR